MIISRNRIENDEDDYANTPPRTGLFSTISRYSKVLLLVALLIGVASYAVTYGRGQYTPQDRIEIVPATRDMVNNGEILTKKLAELPECAQMASLLSGVCLELRASNRGNGEGWQVSGTLSLERQSVVGGKAQIDAVFLNYTAVCAGLKFPGVICVRRGQAGLRSEALAFDYLTVIADHVRDDMIAKGETYRRQEKAASWMPWILQPRETKENEGVGRR